MTCSWNQMAASRQRAAAARNLRLPLCPLGAVLIAAGGAVGSTSAVTRRLRGEASSHSLSQSDSLCPPRWRTGHRPGMSIGQWKSEHFLLSQVSKAHNVNWPGGQCTAPPPKWASELADRQLSSSGSSNNSSRSSSRPRRPGILWKLALSTSQCFSHHVPHRDAFLSQSVSLRACVCLSLCL